MPFRSVIACGRLPSARRRLGGLVLLAGFLASTARANDLCPLSDEFSHPLTLPLWHRVHFVEQWGAEQLESYDIGGTRPGWLTMIPWTCTWYQDWRGPLAFKTVGGDFVVTAAVESTARDGASIPGISFSLGGLMIRAPRDVTPATWTPGGENYVFLSIGYGNALPRRWQFEVKTTIGSASNLILSDAPGPAARLQIARLGDYVVCLRQEPGGPWQVHRRYSRPDFPDTLQVGMVAYTDWDKSQYFAPFVHNGTVLRPPLPPTLPDPNPAQPFHPDLMTRWNYLRFFRPTLPGALVGVDLTNTALVSDADLLAFLGAVADTPCAESGGPEEVVPFASTLRVTRGAGGRPTALRFRVPNGVGYRLDLFDVAGRHRALLATGVGNGVELEARWPEAATRVAGIYLARLEAGGSIQSERVAYTR